MVTWFILDVILVHSQLGAVYVAQVCCLFGGSIWLYQALLQARPEVASAKPVETRNVTGLLQQMYHFAGTVGGNAPIVCTCGELNISKLLISSHM